MKKLSITILLLLGCFALSPALQSSQGRGPADVYTNRRAGIRFYRREWNQRARRHRGRLC